MRKLMRVTAVTAGAISLGSAGLGVAAGYAQAEPDDIDIPDQLCPFRGVIDAMGGDDQCDPDLNNNDNNNGGLFHDNGMPCDSVAFPNPACNPTVNVNIHHDGDGNHNVTINGQQIDPKNITVDKPVHVN